MFAATAGVQHQNHPYQLASHKKLMHVRDLSSTQLLSGSGWLARLAEVIRPEYGCNYPIAIFDKG